MSVLNASQALGQVLGGGAQPKGFPEPPPPAPAGPVFIYFDLELAEENGQAGGAAYGDEPAALRPGRAYHVLVTADVNGREGQRQIFVESDFDLSLHCETAARQRRRDGTLPLLEAAVAGAGARPAEVLRRLRVEAVDRIRAWPTPKDWESFLYTFMYVYYGNPFARLRLAGGHGQGTGT
jgi:hypothetical protein